MAGVTLVGRSVEMSVIEGTLLPADPGPVSLHVQGAAGIGKTSVVRAAAGLARDAGRTVVGCRPAQQEIRLHYSALSDVLEPLHDLLDALPAPQRRALRVAFGREAAGPGHGAPRLVAAAVVELLRRAVDRGPVLLVVDDLQWMDRASRHALEYATRRCDGDLAVLTSSRGDVDPLPAFDPGRAHTLTLGPLDAEQITEIVVAASPAPLSTALLRRIAAIADGNPFYALELARDSDRWTTSRLPPTLQRIVDARLARAPGEVRGLLTTASALADPRVDALRAAEAALDVDELIAQAEEAELVHVERGRVVFTHPLIRAGVYARCQAAERRALHRRLARLAADPESRALHLARAATGPDPETVAALDVGADHGRSRGATSVAADLLDEAIRLGADDADRLVQAAHDHFATEDYTRSLELAQLALSRPVDGHTRARALSIAGVVRFRAGGDVPGALRALEPALALAVGDDELYASVAQHLGAMLVNVGRFADAVSVAQGALAAAERSGNDGLLAELLGADALWQFFHGQGRDDEGLARALLLEDEARETTALVWPSFNAALVAYFTGRFREADDLLSSVRTRCLERGQEGDLWMVEFYAVLPLLHLGRLDEADRHTVEVESRAHASGSPGTLGLALTARAYVQLWAGHVEAAVAGARDASRMFDDLGIAVPPAPAVAALARALRVDRRYGEIVALLADHGRTVAKDRVAHGFAQFLPDLAEALAETGDLAAAGEVVAWMRADTVAAATPWLVSVTERNAGVVAGRSGDVDGARALLASAVDALADEPDPYEEGRAWLALADLERRCRHRHASQEAARRAAAAFAAVRAAAWEAAARRLADPPAEADGELTAMERRVCELSATGLTNRAVAERLGMSTKTVEAHLTRAYRKLAIRSRAELGRAMGAAPGDV